VLVGAFSDCGTTNNDGLCPPGESGGVRILLGGWLIVLGLILVVAVYVRALGATGQTWGRRLVGVKVVDRMTGEPVGIGHALGRQLFACFISTQIFGLGYLWMLWDDRRQTWHDSVVGSIVIEV